MPMFTRRSDGHAVAYSERRFALLMLPLPAIYASFAAARFSTAAAVMPR